MLGGVKWVCWQCLLPLFLFSVIPAEKFCVSWALPLIEYVAVWALKLPVPHTDVLKTHEPQNFSAGITGSQRNWQRTFNLNHILSILTTSKKTVCFKAENFLLLFRFVNKNYMLWFVSNNLC